MKIHEEDSNYKPIIWIKTPKCAGTSLLQAIKTQNLPIDIVAYGMVSVFIKRKSEAIFQDAYKFAIVRNPFDRFISSYHYCIQKGWLDKRVSFREFSKYSWDDIENGSYPRETVIPINKVFQHTRPLYTHLSHDLGNCDYIDEFIRFENLGCELDDLLKRFSMPPIELMMVNASTTRRNFQNYYDDEIKRNVAEKFEKDLEYFGYSFDSLD